MYTEPEALHLSEFIVVEYFLYSTSKLLNTSTLQLHATFSKGHACNDCRAETICEIHLQIREIRNLFLVFLKPAC